MKIQYLTTGKLSLILKLERIILLKYYTSTNYTHYQFKQCFFSVTQQKKSYFSIAFQKSIFSFVPVIRSEKTGGLK